MTLPDYDAAVSELGDPEQVLAELDEALCRDIPRITDELSAVDEEGQP